MSGIRTFEDLETWQVSRGLSQRVYGLTSKTAFGKDYGLTDQIRRAAVSIMTNTAEGFERGSNKDFVRFLFMARGSAGEVRSLLFVALDQKYITEKEFTETRDLCLRVSYMVWGLIKSLRKKYGWSVGMEEAV